MISIIVPTYRERKTIGALLDYLKSNSTPQNITEIIVVDATDCLKTRKIVTSKGAKLITASKGRAIQMNEGARHAKGELLYFLHADSYPPQQFDELIIQHSTKETAAGCFKMQFDWDHPVLKFSAWLTKYRSNLCRGGDQSLFISRSLFFRVGLFNANYIILEDNEIIPRIKKQTKFVVIQENIVTSARRYRENGVWRLQSIFALIHIGYRLGISQEQLLKFYQRQVKG